MIRKAFIKLKRITGKRTTRLAFGIAGLVVLLIINICIYFSEALTGKNELFVVIDAGHGGNDPGKISAGGIKEKDVNLAIAIKLKGELEKRGVKVVLTRGSDVCLAKPGATNKKTADMHERVDIINESGCSLLISIHQNSFTDASVRGAQVFYYGESDDSKRLANILQQELVSGLDPSNHRKAKTGNDYYILRRTSCPGVIIECGFLSCPEEAALLIDDKYQEKLVRAVSDAIEKYNK